MIDHSAREYAYMGVWSDTMSAADITDIVGLEPDRAWSKGEVFQRAGSEQRRRSTSWEAGPTIDPASATIEDQLESLRDRVDPILRRLAAAKADTGCGLVIVQKLSTAEDERHGLTIEEPWIELLGLCGGRVIVDQYVADTPWPMN